NAELFPAFDRWAGMIILHPHASVICCETDHRIRCSDHACSSIPVVQDGSDPMAALSIHEKLTQLANNLWWSWQPEVTAIFREIDPALWSELSHNPILLLRAYPPDKLESRARDEVLHSRINWAYRRWQEYMVSTETWGDTHAGVLGHRPAAYFSAEFGLHESLRIYSGGLGVLAGDHLKSASDLGIPLVGVGLFYQEGYFTQKVDPSGWQQEEYALADPADLPMNEATTPDGDPVVISIQTRSSTIHAKVWQM